MRPPLAQVSPTPMNGARKYMSVEAMTWVLEDAPDFPPHLLGVLMGLANKADKRGRGAWPGQALLATWAKKTDRAARNDLGQLEELGLIRRGDQSLVAHLVADERPVVWDIAMERTHERGRKPTSGPKERTPTSDRKHSSGRKPTSAPSDDAGQETSTGSTVPPGSGLPPEGTGSTVPRDRKHTSANTSLIPKDLLPTEEDTKAREDADSGGLFDAPPAEPKPKPKSRRKPETPIPADFNVTPEMKAWAASKSYTVDLGRQTFRFINHAHEKERRCRDWVAAWRNWIDKAQEIHDEDSRMRPTGTTGNPGNGSGPRIKPNTKYSDNPEDVFGS